MTRNNGKDYVPDAVKINQLSEIFSDFVARMIVLSIDTESVRTVCRKALSDEKHYDLRSRDGYIYAARSMGTKINMEITEHAEQSRKTAEAKRLAEAARRAAEERAMDEFRFIPQMLIADGRSRRRIDFPIAERNPERETNEALQPHDLIYIIGANEVDENNERLLKTDISALKKRSARVLAEIAGRYPNEFEQLRIKGPNINGTEATVYHSDVLRLVANYMEEQALQKILYPPHGMTLPEEAEGVVRTWNAMKRSLAGDEDFMGMAGKHLERLGVLDNELVYTQYGLERKPMGGADNIPTPGVVPLGGMEM